jgi:multidrug efflux system membrane fusion protein
MHRGCLSVFFLLLLAIVGGCQRKTPPIAQAVDQSIPASHPVSRLVTEYVDFTGRANAVKAVNIVPRVTGNLVQVKFKEGNEVKKDELLYEIDPRPYQAQYEAAKAKVALSEASLKLAQVTNKRFKELSKKEASAVSQQDLDKYQALEDEAVANLDLAKANLDAAKLNLDWTKVTSPIDGKISRFYLTEGNLVTQDMTLLTTILSLDPMYAFFDMDEPTYLRIKRAVNEGKITLTAEGEKIPVLMGLQGEEGHPHKGEINFIDNQVFATTGSIAWRGVFPNPKGPGGERVLAPGMFVRIHLPIGQPHQALLVHDRAIWSDQGLKNVYVVDDKNKVQARRVTTGALQEDGLRVVEGLRPNDWVVVGALQQVRPGMSITMDQIPMPTLAPAALASGANPAIKGDTEKGKQGDKEKE